MSVTTIETKKPPEGRGTPVPSTGKATLTMYVKRANGKTEEPVEVPVEVYELNETTTGEL